MQVDQTGLAISSVPRLVRQVINPPRPGKKLLVFDLDYTLYVSASSMMCLTIVTHGPC